MRKAYPLVLLALMLAGCKSIPGTSSDSKPSDSPDTPEGVVKQFYKLLEQGDTTQVRQLMTSGRKTKDSVEDVENAAKRIQSKGGIKELLFLKSEKDKTVEGMERTAFMIKVIFRDGSEMSAPIAIVVDRFSGGKLRVD